MRAFPLDVALANLNLLTFARVVRVVYRDGHFYGFARSICDRSQQFYFDSRAARPCLYVGPAVLHACTAPTKKMLIAGITCSPARGTGLPVFRWWFGDAGPVVHLWRLVRTTPGRRQGCGPQCYRALRRNDDLYLLVRVLVYGDVYLLTDMRQLRPDEQEVHVLREKDGHRMRRGYCLSRDPVEFAAILSEFAGSANVLRAFYTLTERRAIPTDDAIFREYSIANLERRLGHVPRPDDTLGADRDRDHADDAAGPCVDGRALREDPRPPGVPPPAADRRRAAPGQAHAQLLSGRAPQPSRAAASPVHARTVAPSARVAV